jgi:hypothetical protein
LVCTVQRTTPTPSNQAPGGQKPAHLLSGGYITDVIHIKA